MIIIDRRHTQKAAHGELGALGRLQFNAVAYFAKNGQ